MTQTSLKRQVGLFGAIFLGLGSILGTGVFVSLGLAVGVAGEAALISLGLATGLAVMNALSSAQLAANHPASGGTYAYGYRYLTPEFGFIAGVSFLLAKSASAAAAGIGFVSYFIVVFGGHGVPVNAAAAGMVLVMTGLVATGLRRANLVNILLVGTTLLALISLIIASLLAPEVFKSGHLKTHGKIYTPGLFEAAALLFVAFTGYGRIATLGEEVVRPRRTIPWAIIVTLLVTGILYLGVMLSGLAVLGSIDFAKEMQFSVAPLQAIAGRLEQPGLKLFLSVAAMAAMAGVLLNLLLGLSRVAFAMGRQGDAPNLLGRLNSKGEPIFAILCVGGAIALIALFGGLKMVWSFSAFTVLIYYAITNLAALRLTRQERLYPYWVSAFGLMGCLSLMVWVDSIIILLGSGVLCVALLISKGLKRVI